MSILQIVTFPDEFLRNPTKPIEEIDEELQKLIGDMVETMYAAPGVGLAAIQVGHDKSLLIYDLSPGEENSSVQVLINPRIIEREGQIISENEGDRKSVV